MESALRNDGFDEYAIQLIKYKARHLVGHVGFTAEDRQDIEQDLIIDLLQRLSNFNPEKAQHNTFVARVVDNKIASMIEARTTIKRDYRVTVISINEPLVDSDGDVMDHSETISQDDYFFRINSSVRSAVDQHDLNIDLHTAIAQLPEELQRLCQLLSHDSISEVSRTTGCSRIKLYNALKRIRKVFEFNEIR